MQHRADEHIPRHLHRTAALQHDADVRIDLRDLAQKVELVFAQAHMLAVVSFRFAALVQTEEEQHLIASRGERPCPAQQPRRSGSAAEKALFVSGDVHAGSAQRVERRVHLRGIDARAARALIAGARRKLADNRHARVLLQRQQVLVVLQQHKALFRRSFRRRGFFLPAPQAGKSAGKKARSCPGESLRQGGGRRASGPRDALHIRPGGGVGRMRKIVSISACCDAPCRTVGKKGAALPEHCRITV